MPALNNTKCTFVLFKNFADFSLKLFLKKTCFDLKGNFVLFSSQVYFVCQGTWRQICTVFTVFEVCHRCLLTTLGIYCEIYHTYHKNIKCVPTV